jgi:hypothetical protein
MTRCLVFDLLSYFGKPVLNEFLRVLWSHVRGPRGPWLIGLLVLFVVAILQARLLIGSSRLPRLYRIGMLGFPRAGKTSLICAILDYARRAESTNAKVVIRSEETERRLNENIKRIIDGDGPLSTTDEEVFAYRVDVRVPFTAFGLSVPFLHTWYKIEIGDFPGDDTVRFAEKFGEVLHTTPYFNWALDSSAYIFAIDCGKSLGEHSEDYIRRQTNAFEEAWSLILSYHLENKLTMRRAPLVVVFTKADAGLKQLPAALGGGDLYFLEDKLKESFESLIDELNAKSGKFDWEIESLFLEERHRDERWVGKVIHEAHRVPELSQCLGIREIANRILPREIASRICKIENEQEV